MEPYLFDWRRAGRLAATLLTFLAAAPGAPGADSFNLSYPFTDSIMPAGLTLFDTGQNRVPGLTNGSLQLTADQPWESSTLVIDTLPKNQNITRLRAEFDVRIVPGAASAWPADGFSLNFGPAFTAQSVSGENGAAKGISVTFDTYDNGPGDTAPAIEVVYNGNTLAGVEFEDKNGVNAHTTWPMVTNKLITATTSGGWYTLTALGAQGGRDSKSHHQGGYGAKMQGNVLLQPNDHLIIGVGAQGQNGTNYGTQNNISGGGGGGGSSIVLSNASGTKLLLMAGGGGGAAANYDGSSGSSSTGASSSGGTIGSNKYGGAGGAGYTGNGGTHLNGSSLPILSQGGSAYMNGNWGGASTAQSGYGWGGSGGWGGGGQGGPCDGSNDGGGGGGGGYKGGNGGSNQGDGGGGGGSFYDSSVTIFNRTDGANSGDGFVTITSPDGNTTTDFYQQGSQFQTFTLPPASTNFYHVIVEVGPASDGSGSVVSVWWGSQQVLANVKLPEGYQPPANWKLALGARTGLYYETHQFKNLAISGNATLPVTVLTPYGQELPDFDPPIGTHWLATGGTFPITAPPVLWLDQFKRALPAGQAGRAFYKATATGADVNGANNPSTSFTLELQAPTTIKWHYDLQILAEVHSGTESVTNLSPSDITDPTHQPGLGRHFLAAGADTFDSVVYSSIGNAPNDPKSARFNCKGYVLENAPDSPERFLQLAGAGDHLRSGATGLPAQLGASSFTLEFWARLTSPTNAAEQTAFSMGSGAGSPASSQWRAGFGADGGFFLADTNRAAGMPGGWTDDSWHHWAVINDVVANQVRFYRDATLIGSNSPALAPAGGDGVLAIGAQAHGAAATNFFGGGLNNLRLWNTVRTRMQLYTSLQTPVYGTNAGPGLILEMPFDVVPAQPQMSGVYVEQVDSTNILTAVVAVGDEVLTNLVSPNFSVPSAAAVPAAASPGMWRLQSRWTGLPNEPLVSFVINSDSDAGVFLDNQLVAAYAGTNQILQSPVKVTGGNHLLTVLKRDAGTNRFLSLSLTNYPQPYSLPAGTNLYVNVRGLLNLGAETNYSTEGGSYAFQYLGGGDLVPPYETGTNIFNAVLPGFELGLAEAGTTTQSVLSNARLPLEDWRRVFWGWNKQFYYKLSVSSSDSGGLTAGRYLPYFRTELTTVDGVNSLSSGSLGQGVVDVLELWLNEGEQLTVGTIYRTSNRKYTLNGISGQQSMFGLISLDALVDGHYTNSYGGGATREYTFPAVNGPGQLTFSYAPTVHRARIPLGQGFDVSSLAAINAALYPELPVGVSNLIVNLDGPSASDSSPLVNGSIPGGSGNGWVWDFVGKKWHPTKPGQFTITWVDVTGNTNTVEIHAAFPGDPENYGGFFGFENKDGTRQGSPTNNYSYTYNYPVITNSYPGAPLAHYTYNLSPADAPAAPADLDPDPNDAWFFKELSFSEHNTAQVQNTRIFSDNYTSNRSVLVYTHRAAAGQAAKGILSLESVAVRIFRGLPGTDPNPPPIYVGQRLESPYDTGTNGANFHSGLIVNTNSYKNFNPNLYKYDTNTVGQWGPIYPVNARVGGGPLTVNWYQKMDTGGNYPYTNVSYTNIDYPAAAAAPVIYISSQMGSEGVGQDVVTNAPNYQEILDPAKYANLAIYNQPDRNAIGYNPNEEHALIAPSIAYQLTGDPRFNQGQSAAFALQNGLNNTNSADTNGYTSDPFVLVQYSVPGATNASDAFGMKYYAVKTVRTNTNQISTDMFPAVDPVTHTAFDSSGLPVPQSPNPIYDFNNFIAIAGNPVIPPYPLNLVMGNVVMTNLIGGNLGKKRALWQDRTGNRWAVSGDGRFFQRYFYPLRADFWLGATPPPAGTPVSWAPDYGTQQGSTNLFYGSSAKPPVPSIFNTYWGVNYPVLKKGETLTYAGGEYKADHPASPGLPAVLDMASAEIVFDSQTPSMVLTNNPPTPPPGVRYFKFRVSASLGPKGGGNGDDHTELCEFTFYDASGNKLSNQISASGNAQGSQVAANAVDGDTNTWWTSSKGLPQDLVFDLGTAPNPAYYTFTTDGNTQTRSPISWTLYASTDSNSWSNADADNHYNEPIPDQKYYTTPKYAINLQTLLPVVSTNSSARVTRPLDVHTYPLAQSAMPESLQPKNTANVLVSGSRWYFKNLPASLGKRFYYDSLAGNLVFRGRLNNLESGDPSLTQQPIQPYVLEPNFLTDTNKALLLALPAATDDATAWNTAVNNLQIAASTEFTTGDDFGLGVVTNTARPDLAAAAIPFYEDDCHTTNNGGIGNVVPASSFGIGSALAATPQFLENHNLATDYLALAENNDTNATGAVALHVIQLSQERYRGSIQVLTPQDAFSEQINLNHTGDFGGNTAQVYYQWYVRDVCPLAQAGTPDTDPVDWQPYTQGLGLNSIAFTGRPDITLADKFFFVRYGGKGELISADSNNKVTADTTASVTTNSWRAVLPDDPAPDWITASPVPYQWAGAANSPQLQADGSKRYLPQLVMGWVKRVLDEINLYEARYSATFSGDAPATYSSMLQEAGGPYIGAVALNSDKNNLENVGLIALYETVLQRAKDLTSTPGSSNAGTDQAILLAATRLAFLYQLLGSEAFADAQNSVVPQSADSPVALPGDAFAFKNEVANPLQEELSLLRGTDFLKAYPVYNRLSWNYFRADGEAFYNATYNVQDANNDGLIDASDAALQYPMGHGDAWGHYLSATEMHYELVRRPGYGWLAQSELYSQLGNVLPVDFLDEKTFATIAADKIRAGSEIVKATYRDAYVADPAGQWQGYEDTVVPARDWGVSEWSRRVGQGAWFDWLAVTAVTPVPGPTSGTNAPEGLDRIDRRTTETETASVAAGLAELQLNVDNVNRGLNPLGLDGDAMTFDADPYYDGIAWERMPPFKQSLAKAIAAGNNAMAAYQFAAQADQQLRRIADDTSALKREAVLQDLDFKNRLIGLYGTPYTGTIGVGQIFADGYTGPDLLTYMYIDSSTVDEATPSAAWSDGFNANLLAVQATSGGLNFFKGPLGFNPESIDNIMANFYLDGSSSDGIIWATNGANLQTLTNGNNVILTRLPLDSTANYAFTAPDGWGRRTSPGEIQTALNQMLAAELDLNLELLNQNTAFNKVKMLTYNANLKLKAIIDKHQFEGDYQAILTSLEVTRLALTKVADYLSKKTKGRDKQMPSASVNDPSQALQTAINALPDGAFDYFFGARAALFEAEEIASLVYERTTLAFDWLAAATESSVRITELAKAAEGETFSQYNDCVATLNDLAQEYNNLWVTPQPVLATKIQALNMAAAHVRSVQAEAERLVQERAALNQQIAAKAQRNRYADLVTRLNRNEAMRKYDLALDNALRYAWMAVKTYDYETSLSEGHPASASHLLDQIVKTRSLGNWADGQPRVGNGGLAEILGQLSADYDALQGQIGLNNGQGEANILSLRTEMMRISPDSTSDERWHDALANARVSDLWQVPEFRQYCRPFDNPANGPQPGLVIQFSTEIAPGLNFFGQPLSGLDHAFSPANYATKIRSFTAAFKNYDAASVYDPSTAPVLSTSPRFYLVPVGQDRQYCSDTLYPTLRTWDVVSQRIPVPYVLNAGSLGNYTYQPTMDGLDGSYAERIRYGDSRAFISDYGFTGTTDMTLSPLTPGWNSSSRLYGRSVWNTRWLLIIPGATLNANKDAGLTRFINSVTDIKLYLETYSNQGM